MKKGAESLNSVGVGSWQPAEEGSYQGSVRLDDVLEDGRSVEHASCTEHAPAELRVVAHSRAEARQVLVETKHMADCGCDCVGLTPPCTSRQDLDPDDVAARVSRTVRAPLGTASVVTSVRASR
jgi:hypothetical protein